MENMKIFHLFRSYRQIYMLRIFFPRNVQKLLEQMYINSNRKLMHLRHYGMAAGMIRHIL